MKTKINEIFSSIQGEGPVVGYKQLFIRFCGCNLNCNYCDTEFLEGKEYSPQELFDKITAEYDLKTFHSISLTGGEPLLSVDFLKEFLPLIKGQTKIYLETNATLCENLLKIKNNIDIISADIKLETATGLNTFDKHEKFLRNCTEIETFAKIVFDENITKEEVSRCCEIGKNTGIELVLQPKMIDNKMSITSEFCNYILDEFTKLYPKCRLIPQVHKFLDVR
ncbi:MAG: 7-carboxy-7-deazaguanine synthase QueE [Treponema sp.]|nr:7-carboxy-7-deazaguanine synthase QueE [Treponema sp.]